MSGWLQKTRVLALTMVCCTALAQADISITPYGDQIFNGDNSQVLPQGGVVDLSKQGVKIDAAYIEFKPNEYMRAKNATIQTEEGQRIKASSIDYALKADRMEILGPLNFSDANVSGLSSASAVAYPDAGLMVGLGGVQASSPFISAGAMVVDGKKKEAFLYGNYKYKGKDGKTSLQNPDPKASMLINFTNKDRPRILTGSSITAGVRERYVGLIEKNR